MANVLEDLIAENLRTYSPELRAARAVPRDYQATADLKADEDRLDRLAALAEVEVGQLADVAVRGKNVTFQVEEEDGAVSSGFFPLAELSASGSKATRRAREAGTTGGGRGDGLGTPARPGRAPGGTATVETVARDGEPQQPAGVPGNVDELSAKETIALLKSPPEGVDAKAVARYERAKGDDARKSVVEQAEKLGLYEGPEGAASLGSPGGQETPATPPKS